MTTGENFGTPFSYFGEYMSKVTCCRCRWNPFRRCGENTICASCCKFAQKCVEKKVNLCYKCLLQKLLWPQYCCGDAPSPPTNALSSISSCKTQQIKKKREACVISVFLFWVYWCKNQDDCLFFANVYSLNHKTIWHIFHSNRNVVSVFRRIDAINL